MTDDMDDDRRAWHVEKGIPLALMFALFAQTGGWIWWAATQSAKLDTLTAMVSDFKTAQYTQNDARRDLEMGTARHAENRRRIESLEARLIPEKTRYLKDYR